MRTLADLQAGIRDALVRGDCTAVAPLLRGGTRPERRLAIHQRHYAASLTRALVERFPATVWLVGSDLVMHAAQAFIRDRPPSKPCIAEYGETFPRYLGTFATHADLPYLAQFAELEWHLGRLALATEASPHTYRLLLHWSLDELMAVYLADKAPERFALRREEVLLEIRGMRGEIHMHRLTRDGVITCETETADEPV